MSSTERDTLIIVALSGGVDSAVAAWRLQQQGCRVEALHMTNWEDDDGYCSAAEDLRAARSVAAQLGLPLHLANFSDAYRQRVFQEFLHEYSAGRTPNPDVLCNREIKFGECLAHARRLGASYLATGHYARVAHAADGSRLLRAADENKDQTYFLHAVPEAALAHALFPLGDLTKQQVRAMAREIGLRNWDRPDSTGICFIGERPFREFLGRHLQAEPGPIESPEGLRLGTHAGLSFYTPGQRAGLQIGGVAGAEEAPWYVAAKRSEDNTLVAVQGRDHPALLCTSLHTSGVHWINGPPAALLRDGTMHALARIRHRQPLQRVCLQQLDGPDQPSLRVRFEQPQRGVAPGQYVVFYENETCLGGGSIRIAPATPAEHHQDSVQARARP